MPRGDISKTIAHMREIAEDFDVLAAKFRAEYDLSLSERMTEEHRLLRSWANWFAFYLIDRKSHVLHIVDRAENGPSLAEPPDPL